MPADAPADHLAVPARRIEFTAAAALPQHLSADLCVVGAGAAGLAAAVLAGQRGLRVLLLDAAPTLGGQQVNALVGTLCGFFSGGDDPQLLTQGSAADLIRTLGASGALSWRRARGTTIALYDEQALAAFWAAQLLALPTVQVLLGATLAEVQTSNMSVTGCTVHTRHGALHIAASTFIDASGDAVLAAKACHALHTADVPVYGTVMFTLDNLNPPLPSRDEVVTRLQQVAHEHGLARKDGFVFGFDGGTRCLVNLTHIPTPLDALAMSGATLQAHQQAGAVLAFLQAHWPQAFGMARIGRIGQPGVRQTRGVVGQATLRLQGLLGGTRPADAVARSGWPIEFHGHEEGVTWMQPGAHSQGGGPLAWVPYSALVARDLHNLLAAGRCIDAEPMALAGVRVIGPCIAMGQAAAVAATLAVQQHAGHVHAVPLAAVLADPAVAANLDGGPQLSSLMPRARMISPN